MMQWGWRGGLQMPGHSWDLRSSTEMTREDSPVRGEMRSAGLQGVPAAGFAGPWAIRPTAETAGRPGDPAPGAGYDQEQG